MADETPQAAPGDGAARHERRRSILRRLMVGVPLLLALGPPIVLVRTVREHAVNVPLVDQWTFAEDVTAAYDGRLSLASLWRQHNEHRIPVARAVLLGLAWATRWDVRWEMALGVTISLAALLVVAWLIVRTVAPTAPMAVGWLVLWAALMQCSLVQWKNWIWGWQVGLFITLAAGPVTAMALARMGMRGRATAPSILVALVAPIVATFSNGAGLVLLVLVPPALVAMRATGVRVAGWVLAVSVTAACVVFGSYLVGWHPAPSQPPPTPVAGHVMSLVTYAVTFLGSPISPSSPAAWRWGVVAVGVLAASAGAACWLPGDGRARVLPWLLLGGYAIGIACVVAVGRFGAGPHTARISRYSTYAIPLWIAVGPAATVALAAIRHRRSRMLLAGALVVLACVVGASVVREQSPGAARLASRARMAQRAATCLRDPESAPDSCYRMVCWSAAFARRGAIALRDRGLSLWSTGAGGTTGLPLSVKENRH